jgi:hypothetical protein
MVEQAQDEVSEDEVIFKEVLKEACGPVEEAMGEEEAKECQMLIMELGQGEIDATEFESNVEEQLGEDAFDMMQNALSLFD